MNLKNRELLVFWMRGIVILAAIATLFLQPSRSPFFPIPFLLASFLIYILFASLTLKAKPEGILPLFFLVLDVLWIFFICLESGPQIQNYAWLFVLPLVSILPPQAKEKIWLVFLLSLLSLLMLGLISELFSKLSISVIPFSHLLLEIFVLLGISIVLVQHFKEELPAPILKSKIDEPKEDYNLKLRQIVFEKEIAMKQLHDKMRQHAILYEIIGHITHTLDLEKILELTAKRSREELRAEISFLMLVSGNEVVVRHSENLSQPAANLFRSKIGEKPFGEMILTGEALHESLSDEKHPVLDTLAPLKNIQRIRDILAVPLKSPILPGLSTRGLLGIANSLESPGFTRDTLEMLTILAGQVVIAMDNAEMMAKQKTFFKETIQAFAAAINQKHRYTHVLHSKSVAKWAVDIAHEMKLPPDLVEKIEIAAILHDVGKIAIPDEILTKPGQLSPEEMKIMQEHAEKGKEILKGISMLDEIVPWIHHHHERWDGKGYPAGLVGDQIPLGAQVIMVADAFDAMTANRPYHKGLTVKEACEVIKNEAGKQFGPKVVEAFLSLMKKRESSGIPFETVA
jgi:putative nucleotidyltransferase with HDIG domain